MLWGPVAIAPVMKRPWTAQILLPLVILVSLAVSCDRLLRNLRGEPDQATVQPIEDTTATEDTAATEDTTATEDVGNPATTESGQTLTHAPTGTAITVPDSWTNVTGLHDAAELQAADVSNELYLIVVSEASPILRRAGLPENAAQYRALLKDQLAAFDSESPTGVDFIDGEVASQYEIRGQLADGTPVVYLHTTVVTPARYYQIVGWAPPAQFEAYRSELQNITSTFREISS